MPEKQIVVEWQGQEGFAQATRDITVEVRDGTVRLFRRVLLADEMGNCTGRDVEVISGSTWARKEFRLASAQAAGARISIWLRCSDEAAMLIAKINGHPLTVHPLPRAQRRRPDGGVGSGYWRINWRTVDFPPDWLQPGLNVVTLHTEDGSRWETLIETSRLPNRSAKSIDSGQSWDYDHLGYNDCYDGEYLMRLELDRYPEQGRIASPPIDLATVASGDALGQPVVLGRAIVEGEAEIPAGTEVEFELRAGPTPRYDPQKWSAWRPAADFQPRTGDRFIQWQAILKTSEPLCFCQTKARPFDHRKRVHFG